MSLARCGVPAAVALAVHGGISPAGGTAGAQLCSQAQHSSCDVRLPSGWEHPPSIGMPSGAVGQVGCLAFLRPLRQPCRGLGTLGGLCWMVKTRAWMVKTRALTHPPVLQMMSPPGSMGSCTSLSTPPRASSSQPVSAGACPCV